MNRADHLKPIPNREDHRCFACGPANDCGLKMKFFTGETAVFSWLTIPGHHRGWDRLVHGGITSTILDEIMSWSALYLLKKVILTKKMTVEFLNPIYVGANLRAVRGHIRSSGPENRRPARYDGDRGAGRRPANFRRIVNPLRVFTGCGCAA